MQVVGIACFTVTRRATHKKPFCSMNVMLFILSILSCGFGANMWCTEKVLWQATPSLPLAYPRCDPLCFQGKVLQGENPYKIKLEQHDGGDLFAEHVSHPTLDKELPLIAHVLQLAMSIFGGSVIMIQALTQLIATITLDFEQASSLCSPTQFLHSC